MCQENLSSQEHVPSDILDIFFILMTELCERWLVLFIFIFNWKNKQTNNKTAQINWVYICN